MHRVHAVWRVRRAAQGSNLARAEAALQRGHELGPHEGAYALVPAVHKQQPQGLVYRPGPEQAAVRALEDAAVELSADVVVVVRVAEPHGVSTLAPDTRNEDAPAFEEVPKRPAGAPGAAKAHAGEVDRVQ